MSPGDQEHLTFIGLACGFRVVGDADFKLRGKRGVNRLNIVVQ